MTRFIYRSGGNIIGELKKISETNFDKKISYLGIVLLLKNVLTRLNGDVIDLLY